MAQQIEPEILEWSRAAKTNGSGAGTRHPELFLGADLDGRALVWRGNPKTRELVREEARFLPWLVLDRLDDLRHVGERLTPDECQRAQITYRELEGPGSLRYLVSASDGVDRSGVGGCVQATRTARLPPAGSRERGRVGCHIPSGEQPWGSTSRTANLCDATRWRASNP